MSNCPTCGAIIGFAPRPTPKLSPDNGLRETSAVNLCFKCGKLVSEEESATHPCCAVETSAYRQPTREEVLRVIESYFGTPSFEIPKQLKALTETSEDDIEDMTAALQSIGAVIPTKAGEGR